MSGDLERLLEAARKVQMSDEDREEQRRSFAYGSAKIENDDITRETVAKAAAQLTSK